MRIRHDVLKGLSPKMLAWWFANIGGDMDVDGQRLNRYLVWPSHRPHKVELIRTAPDGKIGPGAVFRIVEAFAPTRTSMSISRTLLSASAWTALRSFNGRMGIEVARLNHDFAAVDGGASYFSTLTIGASMPAVRSLLNRFLHSFVFTEQWGAPGCATTSRKSAPSNTSCRGSIRVSGGTMCLAAIAARHCSRPIDHSNV